MPGLSRINPNLDPAVAGAMYAIKTEVHDMTVEVRPVGPQTKGFLLSFVRSEPPITEAPYYPTEIYVKDNEVKVGETFELSTMFPILSQTAFKAVEIMPVVVSEEAGAPIVSQQ